MWVEPIPGKKGTKYKFCERIKDPTTGKDRKISVTLDRNTAAARKKALDILRSKAPRASEPRGMTFDELTALYLQDQAQVLKPSTLIRNKRQAKSLARILGGNTIVKDLSAGYINQCFAASGEGNATINERLVRLKALLRWAYINDYLPDAGFIDKLKPRPDKTRKEKLMDKYMEPSELSALLNAMTAAQPKWTLVTRFLCLSGLRIGELIALQDADVGPEYISIHATYNVEVGLINTPKTDASAREVYIQPELAACIRDIRQLIRLEKLRLGYQSDLFIPDEDGGYIRYESYRHFLGERSEAAIGRRMTPHACRHTMTSLFAAAGVPLDVIARRLGHEDSAITRKIYFHITDQLREKDNGILKAVNIL